MWVVYCTPYKPWCWLTVVCYLQGMPDRMLCAVLEQFQLYFSLWYVRFVSIQSVISSCVLMLKRPVHFYFSAYTHAHKHRHEHTLKITESIMDLNSVNIAQNQYRLNFTHSQWAVLKPVFVLIFILLLSYLPQIKYGYSDNTSFTLKPSQMYC